MSNGHILVRCSCGKVIQQCRCPGPKTEEVRPHPACEQARQQGPMPNREMRDA